MLNSDFRQALSLVCLLLILMPAWLAAEMEPAEPLWTVKPQLSSRQMDRFQGARAVWPIEVHLPSLEDPLDQILLPLPGRVQVSASLERLEARSPDSFTWYGSLSAAHESAVFRVDGRVLAGALFTRQGTFETRYDPQHGQVLIELDSESPPQCSGAVAPDVGFLLSNERSAAAERSTPSSTFTDRGTAYSENTVRIDALIVQSPGFVTELGGAEQAHTISELAIDLANLSFRNSDVDVVVRTVGIIEADMSISTNCFTDLAAAQQNSEIRALRDQYRADIVVALTDGSYCGCGYVQQAPGFFFDWAYSVTSYRCTVGSLTVAHEIGHNLGMEHNPENGAAPEHASFPHSFGHRINGHFKTVMSYFSSDACSDGCPRIPHFSNPDITVDTVPTGIIDQRDNALTARKLAPDVAAFFSADDEDYPEFSFTPASISIGIAPNSTRDFPIQLHNDGAGLLRWQLGGILDENQNSPEGPHVPELDEPLHLGDFDLVGGENYIMFDRYGGFSSTGEVTGMSFSGTVALEPGDRADKLEFFINAPDGQPLRLGWASNRWDFQGDTEGGLKVSHHVNLSSQNPKPDRARWRFWVKTNSDTGVLQSWSGVTMTLHKRPLDDTCTHVASIPWIQTIVPAMGELAAGSVEEISIRVDSSGMSPGLYTANICLTSADPRKQPASVPITLSVQGSRLFEDRFEAASVQ